MPPQNPFAKEHPLSILKSIVETAIDGIFLMDTEGIILMCNPAGHSLFGYIPGELVGKDITILMPSPHRQNHATYVHNYLRTGIKKIIGIGREIEALRKNGTLFPARLGVSEIIMDEQHYFTGIIHDLTQFKNIERELVQLNQELEKMVSDRTNELQDAINRLLDTNLLLNQSIEKHKADEIALMDARDELKRSLEKEKELGILKSRFISMASHEFKTPLSSILSSAALISRYETTEQADDRRRHVERIKASVTHLNLILTDFLSISKLEEGLVHLKITKFTIDTLITDLMSEMEVLLKKGQELTFDYNTTQLEMCSDKNIIRNILYNLLSNAIKYSEENQPIHGVVTSNEKNIIIEIRDRGIGIPTDDLKHIGTRFFRASNASHIQGTGLGLNIVHSYLNFLRGSLTFTNHEEGGTTFTLTIPALHEK
ncbi:MAG TPA: PAS domain-containing sensor histidine kinase [Saprospiraceae bacterium]|nr:PAS domain-containing sensor histidine kinase [Saprospiraceae bacterium]